MTSPAPAEDRKSRSLRPLLALAPFALRYKGRIALYEVMRFSDPLKDMVLQGGSTAELKTAAIRGGMKTLRMAGIEKICAGMTTIEEVGRVTMGD